MFIATYQWVDKARLPAETMKEPAGLIQNSPRAAWGGPHQANVLQDHSRSDWLVLMFPAAGSVPGTMRASCGAHAMQDALSEPCLSFNETYLERSSTNPTQREQSTWERCMRDYSTPRILGHHDGSNFTSDFIAISSKVVD